jgi:hypothetical protein
VWAVVAAVLGIPLGLAATSTLLAFRDPVYIAAGLAGIIALALMFLQPLLVGGYLPGLGAYRGRRVHRWIGAALVLAVAIHVAGLWITSPPDVIDALLFVSPTPFSVWGVISMWAIFTVAVMVALRGKLGLRPRTWRMGHTCLAVLIVTGSIVHGLLIEGTMETMSKVALSILVLAATLKAVADLRVWQKRARAR